MKKFLAVIISVLLICSLFAGCAPKETIVVGYTIYAPMNYFEGEELIGFDTDLAKAVFEGLGYKVVFKEIDWKAKYTELNSGNINCIWNGFTSNSADDDGVQRKEKVDFSYNYMENLQVVVVKADSNIATKEDLTGKIADAEIGSAGETYAKKFEGTKFKGSIKQTDCLLSVKSGNADFAVLDVQLANSYVGKGDYADLKIVDGLSSDLEYYAIGFKKDSELTAKVNAQLEKLAKNGTLKKIADEYKLGNSVVTDFTSQK